jgi:hypothetical protein
VTERIEKLKRLVEFAYECRATHVKSSPVREIFNEQVVWEGVVETFEIEHHPTATCCYAFRIMEDGGPKWMTVLKLPPVDSPITAVRAAISSRQYP